ncbi:protein-glutamine gamma-glutamyltransferase E-like [Spea bombifrons]|uniref:protein-glutamine gamma-glutamyltransferase E-like n=1 Tax=Spea bombifrons TaxID=233779 RepID=UPI0023490743|nr:protein-glutamine gamma-glutamyltransferase E-like [Spea bombifrons]
MTSLLLTNWNFQQSINEPAHRTSDFISNELILRRGQAFTIILTFNRRLQFGDSLSLTTETGPSPSESSNTKAVMPISSSGSRTAWSAASASTTSNPMTVTINIPVIAVIGRYRLSLQITSGGRTSSRNLGEMFVLFNPWASGDEVYMNSDTERQEYVLNETGLIFYGSANSRGSRRWDYGQFEEGVLPIVLTMLDRSPEYRRDPAADVSKRNSPSYVGRVLSAMVNSNDDDGVLIGNWSGDYSGGVSPTTWNGSVPILRSWIQNGPVAFGQCWVYAGVLCTALRCLGIPARLITNFESAHDTDQNLIVDRYYDEYGNALPWSADSVWNFHAWDEGWFVRKDLGNFYSGWQILDSTPQEPSQGSFRLGPTSLKAVKEGDVNLDFDTPFVFAEVNADKADWVVYGDGSRRRIYNDTRSIGQFTSTKAVGAFTRVDVTNDYKYAEGTAKEREVFQKARSNLPSVGFRVMSRRAGGGAGGAGAFSAAERTDEPAPKPDFTGTFKLSGQPQVGENVVVPLALKNTAADTKSIKVNITATAIVYTRAPVKEILSEEKSVSLGPNEEKNVPVTVSYSQYKNAITTDNMIQLVAVCEDDKGGRLLVDTVVTLKSPPLLIQITGQPALNKPFTVDIIFSNPISEDVANSRLIVEGSGLLKQPLTINAPPLKPKQRSVTEFQIFPYRTGERSLMVDFSSDKFSDVKAYQTVNVAST